jgi:predicted ArsR family transcriptional regulator
MQLPQTSHDANKEMTAQLRQQHHDKILSSLQVLGEAIYEDIAKHTGMDRHQVGRRLKELVDAGKIYNTLKTGLTSTGRKANMYAIRN